MSLRLVLDTNIWLDWLVFRDAGIETLKTMVASGLAEIYIDPDCQRELVRVLAYPRRNSSLTAAVQAACMEECGRIARYAELGKKREDTGAESALPLPRCRDPDDQKFLELAHNCGADYLITKDNALLALARRRIGAAPFCIVTPRQFDALRATQA